MMVVVDTDMTLYFLKVETTMELGLHLKLGNTSVKAMDSSARALSRMVCYAPL
jgi:hypothetical protein